MSDYVVSARKYRPDSFESLIGQDNIARTLKNSILRGQLAHAYLFCGPRGVGKTSAARIFAKTINCANPSEDMEPCGKCESCLSFQEGRSYCIHELDAASNNGVEDIKALMDQVQIPPQVGRYSVYIIDEVHMLSQSAFNAFLKTLEEPPAHAIFILATTEKHKILPTILSRCQTYDFNRIGIPDIVRNLKDIAGKENIRIDDESLHVIAHKADGAMRDALTIFDQTVAFCGTDVRYEDVIRNLNVLDYEYSFKLVEAFLRKDYAAALLTFDEILAKGFNAIHFISALGTHFRDLLVSRTGGLESLLDFPDSLRQRYREQALRCSVKFIYDALGILSQCEAGYRSSANQRLHIEYALMKLSFLVGEPAADRPSAIAVPSVAAKPAEAPAVNAAAPASVENERLKTAPAEVPAASASAASVLSPAPAVASPSQAKSPSTSEPAGQEAAPARRRAPKTGANLSLSAMFSDDDIVIEPVEETVADEALPSDEQLKTNWKKLVETITDKPRLANALANAKLTVSESDGKKLVEFSVTNDSQRSWIRENLLRSLEDKFCEINSCRKIILDPVVIPEAEQPVKIYMPGEQAEDLMSRNSEVKELVIDLGLEIK